MQDLRDGVGVSISSQVSEGISQIHRYSVGLVGRFLEGVPAGLVFLNFPFHFLEAC